MIDDEDGVDVEQDIRADLTRALWKCTPKQRRWFRALPKHGFGPYAAGSALGFSKRTIYRWLRDETVKKALALQSQVEIDDLCIDHRYLLTKLREIADGDLRVPGSGVVVEESPGEFGTKVKLADPIRAAELLTKYTRLVVDRREITGADGTPLTSAPPVIQIMRYEDEDESEAVPSTTN